MKTLDTVSTYYSNNADVYRVLGATSLDMGFNQKAVVYLENSFALNNSSVETAGLLVRAYRKVGNTEGANKILDSLRQAFPDNQSVLDAINTLDSSTKQGTSTTDQTKTTSTKAVKK